MESVPDEHPRCRQDTVADLDPAHAGDHDPRPKADPVSDHQARAVAAAQMLIDDRQPAARPDLNVRADLDRLGGRNAVGLLDLASRAEARELGNPWRCRAEDVIHGAAPDPAVLLPEQPVPATSVIVTARVAAPPLAGT